MNKKVIIYFLTNGNIEFTVEEESVKSFLDYIEKYMGMSQEEFIKPLTINSAGKKVIVNLRYVTGISIEN